MSGSDLKSKPKAVKSEVDRPAVETDSTKWPGITDSSESSMERLLREFMSLKVEITTIKTSSEDYAKSLKALDDKYTHLFTDKKREKIFGSSKESEGKISKKVHDDVEEKIERAAKEYTTVGDGLKLKIESYDKSVYIQEWILQVDELIKRRVYSDKDRKLLIYSHLPQDLKRLTNRDLANNLVTYEEYKANLCDSHGPNIDTILGEFYALTPIGEEDVVSFMDRVISMGNIGGLQEIQIMD